MPLTRSQRDQWAEELESGRWRQGTHGLLDDDGRYCCLGVFASCILGLSDEEIRKRWSDYRIAAPYIGEEANDTLYNRNDGTREYQRHTFPEIAKHVRALPVSEEEG